MDLNYNITLNYDDKEVLHEGISDSIFLGIIKGNKIEVRTAGSFKVINAISILCAFSHSLVEHGDSIPDHVKYIIKKFVEDLEKMDFVMDFVTNDKNKLH